MNQPNPDNQALLNPLMDQLEDGLRPMLQLLLPTLGYRTTLDFLKHLVVNILRDMHRDGWTQQQLADELGTTRVTIGTLINDRELRRRPIPADREPSILLLVLGILGARAEPMTTEEVSEKLRPMFPTLELADLQQRVADALSAAKRDKLAINVTWNGRLAYRVGEHGPDIKLETDAATRIAFAERRAQLHFAFQKKHMGEHAVGPRATQFFRASLTSPLAEELLTALREQTRTLIGAYEERAREERSTAAQFGATPASLPTPFELELIWIASNAALEALSDGPNSKE